MTSIVDVTREMQAAGVDPVLIAKMLTAFAERLPDARVVDAAAERRRAWDRDRKAVKRAEKVSAGKSGGMSGGNPPDPAPSVPLPPDGPLPFPQTPNPTPLNPPAPLRSQGAAADDFPSDAFDRFWSACRHKVGKADAEKAFVAVRRSGQVTFAALMAGLERYIRTKSPDRPWCNPATWLRQARWADEPDTDDGKRAANLFPGTASSRGGSQPLRGSAAVEAGLARFLAAGDAGGAGRQLDVGRDADARDSGIVDADWSAAGGDRAAAG